MSSLSLKAGFLLLAAASTGVAADGVFRVCADPNNLPFSNDRREGFENRLAEMIADDLGSRVEFTWWQERRGFIRNTLNAGRCDAIFGVPAGVDQATLSRPYYRSTYVFVSRRDLAISSLSDPRLANLKIGVHLTGDDYPPPIRALEHRGVEANLKPYPLFGPLGEPNPPSRLIEAVGKGDVDVAIAWGPFAGYFGKDLRIVPVSPSSMGSVPFVFDLTIAVHKGNDALKNEIDSVLRRECLPIRELLLEYRVPLVGGEGETSCEPSQPSPAYSR